QLGEAVCVVDLRGTAERASAACVLPGATVHSLPVEPTVASKLDALAATGEALTAQAARRFMAEAYAGFVRNARPQLAAFFAHLVDTPAQPTVLHCAAGKDRTGFVTAMLLAALDVPRATVIDDYLHTNARLQPKQGGRFPPEIMQVLATVHADFLDAAYAAIDADFGGVDAYLAQGVGLAPAAREQLRAQLLA
ncbi:MAG: tyrosine-protein phosphatase, partial [Comamonadaceae bacterium]